VHRALYGGDADRPPHRVGVRRVGAGGGAVGGGRGAGRCRARGVRDRAHLDVPVGVGLVERALRGDDRGGGRRTRVWIEGVNEPIVASRTERTILHEMGQDAAGAESLVIDRALDLAERLVEQTQAGRVDLNDLSRRARRVLETTSRSSDDEQLF
jgi:hypothetical protein